MDISLGILKFENPSSGSDQISAKCDRMNVCKFLNACNDEERGEAEAETGGLVFGFRVAGIFLCMCCMCVFTQ